MSENRPATSATSDVPVVEPAAPVAAPVPVAPAPVVTPAPAPAPEPAAPEPGPIAARFGQLAAQRREAEARTERLEKLVSAQGEQLTRALAALKPVTQPPAPAPASPGVVARPVRDAFPDQETYESELVSWAGTQAASTTAAELRRVQEEAETARQERTRADEEARVAAAREAEDAQRAAETRTAWDARRAKALETYPDFSAVAEADALPISLAMAHTIVSQENGPEILYHLGKNPSEAARIAAMVLPNQVFPEGSPYVGLPVPNAVAQAFELGRIAAKLGTAPVEAPVGEVPASEEPPVVPPVSGPIVTAPAPVILPAPPTPISGASAAATRKDPNEMTMDEYAAARRPALLAERRPGRVH